MLKLKQNCGMPRCTTKTVARDSEKSFWTQLSLHSTRFADTPCSGASYKGRFRRYLVQQFPYGVDLNAVEGQTIYVAAVIAISSVSLDIGKPEARWSKSKVRVGPST